MAKGKWYYNLDTHQVEPYEADKNANRLGPYKTQDEAAHAMEKFQQRQEAWETDPRFNDPVDPEEEQRRLEKEAEAEWELPDPSRFWNIK